MKTSKRSKTATAIIVILILAGCGAIFLQIRENRSAPGPSEPPARSGKPGSGAPQSEAPAAPSSPEMVPERRERFQTFGSLEAVDSVTVYPDVSGKLVALHTAIGRFVQQGETIAEADPSRPGEKYAVSAVTAPVSGFITALPFSAGDTVSANIGVAEISSLNRLVIKTSLPERYAGSFPIGTKAEYKLESQPETRYGASVSFISPILDPVTRTLPIELKPERALHTQKAGMFVTVYLSLPEGDPE